MKKHLFSTIILGMVMFNACTLMASSTSQSPDELTRSVKRGRNYTLGPGTDDISCIATLELLLQEPFRQQAPLKIKPQIFKNENQVYNLFTPSCGINTSSLDEDEKKALAYLEEQREKSILWREAQNRQPVLKAYTTEPLDEGERDSLKGARRTNLALQWLVAQIYELKITTNRVKHLIELIEQEYKIKSQILGDYQQAKTNNKLQPYTSLHAWYVYANNYGFSAKECSVLWDIYSFQFRFDTMDDQSRQAHKRREDFVSEIPKSYTPKTLPRKPENSKASKIELASCLDNNYSREEYTQFLSEERKTDPDFSITFDEYCAYQRIIQDEKKADENFCMSYSDYEAYLKSISILPELEIRPKDYMVYAVAQRRMKIALSYQDYLDKMGIREELKLRFRKKESHKEDAIKFSSLKQELLNLLGDYQGENKGVIGGLLGKYLEWHEKVETLDKELLKLKILSISLYQPQGANLTPLVMPLSLTRPYYVLSDNFKIWEEIGEITAPDLEPIEDRLFAKTRKKTPSKKQGERVVVFPENFILKTKEFIRKAYLDFGSDVFLLGLFGDQVEYLYGYLQKGEEAIVSHMIKGLRPLKIGGKEWVVSLAPITHLEFKVEEGQDLSKIPSVVQHSDPTVAKRLQKRIEAYKLQNSKHEIRIIELKGEIKQLARQVSEAIQPQKLKLKELSQKLNSEEILNILGSPLSTGDVFEEEQRKIVDILSSIFMPQEVQDVSDVFLPEEDDSIAVEDDFDRKRMDLKQILQARVASKGFDVEEKSQVNLALDTLQYVPEIFEKIKILREREKELIKEKIKKYNIQWLYYFYAHLQSISWKQDQRLRVSFEGTQFSQTQKNILNFIRMAYQDLYEDVLGFKSQNEVIIHPREPHNKGLEILINLQDLQIPTVTKEKKS